MTDATDAADVTAEADATDAPAPARRRGKPLALAAAAVAVVLLSGGAVAAYAALDGADRSAPTAYWAPAGQQAPDPDEPANVPLNNLSGKLLPRPAPGFGPGPDMDANGNDFFISGEQAVEGFKRAREGLSSSERKKRDDMLADLKLKGLAGRTWQRADRDHDPLVLEIQVMQADPRAVQTFSDVTKKLMAALGDARDAPKVNGFPDARCALIPVGEPQRDGEIDSLSCVSVEGDVMVSFRAYGPKKHFPKSEAAGFFKDQLTRLKSPGESV
ncbi:hypothetical protein OOK31_33630 [Streptomyces sp. NBC_00249]|uniref:hypothetical protein n=1 Tax=Streptomyces sp. NBC_00249 TaxID=2975690 RepID=UPI00224DEBA5|nr:hypothetical protein [Streptomyces sp. NBC_00249]MCX5198770.1 hypothetical protein [Streptomyces sp. NBC_00249]